MDLESVRLLFIIPWLPCQLPQEIKDTNYELFNKELLSKGLMSHSPLKIKTLCDSKQGTWTFGRSGTLLKI